MGIIEPSLAYERSLWEQGAQWVGGTDEVGRGALAGPVVAAVVVLPANEEILGILAGLRDSKMLSAKRRAALLPVIKEHALSWAVGEVSAADIDAIGIVKAVIRAMMEAFDKSAVRPDAMIIDALTLPLDLPQLSFPKADAHSLTVAAASIVAKEYRDDLMRTFALDFPAYGFEKHVGYGAPAHFAALREHGLCAIHRRSFLRSLGK